jgi:hypothetical protein
MKVNKQIKKNTFKKNERLDAKFITAILFEN